MLWKDFAPYLVALLAGALIVRRLAKAQQARSVKTSRLWVVPSVLVVSTAMTLASVPAPSFLTIIAYLFAAGAGGAFGWYRVHTLEFSIDPNSGAIMSKATPLGAIVLVGLLLFRYALKYFLQTEGLAGLALARWTDGLLVFTAAMLVTQSVHTWVRARQLLPGKASVPLAGPPD